MGEQCIACLWERQEAPTAAVDVVKDGALANYRRLKCFEMSGRRATRRNHGRETEEAACARSKLAISEAGARSLCLRPPGKLWRKSEEEEVVGVSLRTSPPLAVCQCRARGPALVSRGGHQGCDAPSQCRSPLPSLLAEESPAHTRAFFASALSYCKNPRRRTWRRHFVSTAREVTKRNDASRMPGFCSGERM